jgi:hypothetical protein
MDKQLAVRLTQSGTDAPVATIIRNTLGGTPVWSYVSPGVYTCTLLGAFDPPDNVIFDSSIAVELNDANSFTITASADDVLSDDPLIVTVYEATITSTVTDQQYIVKLTQTGTDAPVASVIRNTLGGDPVWTYVSAGVYTCTLTGGFSPTANVMFDSSIAVTLNDSNSFTITVAGMMFFQMIP